MMQINWPRIERSRRRSMMKEARCLLDFACQCYKLQNDAGRIFIHEHPSSAKSWKEEGIERIAALPGVHKVSLDMCRFGLKVKTKTGHQLVKKPTCLLTNSKIIAETLNKKCDGSHKHCRLEGGNLCSQAAVYSPDFCKAIVSAFKRHCHKHGNRVGQVGSLKARDFIDSKENLLQIAEDDPGDMPSLDELLNMFDGIGDARFPESSPNIDGIDEEMEAWDDVKGTPLIPHLVQEARDLEMKYVRDHTVYEYSTLKECRERTGANPVETRWIDINKGDDANPPYRSRWVAKDFRKSWVETIFAATPNIESVCLLLADAANNCAVSGNLKGNTCVVIIDIKRAYFYAPAQNDIYIKLHHKIPEPERKASVGNV